MTAQQISHAVYGWGHPCAQVHGISIQSCLLAVCKYGGCGLGGVRGEEEACSAQAQPASTAPLTRLLPLTPKQAVARPQRADDAAHDSAAVDANTDSDGITQRRPHPTRLLHHGLGKLHQVLRVVIRFRQQPSSRHVAVPCGAQGHAHSAASC
jgi:hypothetical protein